MTIVEQKLKNSLWPIDATKLLLIVIVFISLLSIAGCKKCMLCSDTCYQCSSGLSVCSADVSTPQIFDSLIANQIEGGQTCSVVKSTNSFTICDTKQTRGSFKTYASSVGYTCNDK